MGTIINKRPPPPKNFDTKRICKPQYTGIVESFEDTTSCFTNNIMTVIVNRSKCLNEQEYIDLHSHDTTERSARITCSSCNSVRYINAEDYIKNPFIFKCDVCSSYLIIVEYIEYCRVLPIIEMSTNNNAYSWFHYICNHQDIINDTTSCEVFI